MDGNIEQRRRPNLGTTPGTWRERQHVTQIGKLDPTALTATAQDGRVWGAPHADIRGRARGTRGTAEPG